MNRDKCVEIATIQLTKNEPFNCAIDTLFALYYYESCMYGTAFKIVSSGQKRGSI